MKQNEISCGDAFTDEINDGIKNVEFNEIRPAAVRDLTSDWIEARHEASEKFSTTDVNDEDCEDSGDDDDWSTNNPANFSQFAQPYNLHFLPNPGFEKISSRKSGLISIFMQHIWSPIISQIIHKHLDLTHFKKNPNM